MGNGGWQMGLKRMRKKNPQCHKPHSLLPIPCPIKLFILQRQAQLLHQIIKILSRRSVVRIDA